MKRRILCAFALIGLSSACLGGCKDKKSDAGSHSDPAVDPEAKTPIKNATATVDVPPPSRRGDTVDTLHGVEVPDPYRWLEDTDAPETRSWLDAQDTRARAVLHRLPGRDALVKRFKELYYRDETEPPIVVGGRYFYSRQHRDKEKEVVYWKDGEDGEERVLLDPNTWSQDGSVSLRDTIVPTKDGRLVLYKKSENNADEATLYVRDVATGQDSTIDVIPGAKYAEPAWTPDGKGFYYAFLPMDPGIPVNERPGYAEIRYHELGTDPKGDRLVFPALHDPRMFLDSALSDDGRWLFLYLRSGWSRTVVYVKDLEAANPKVTKPGDTSVTLDEMDTLTRAAVSAGMYGFEPFVVDIDAIFSIRWWQGRFYILTNHGAKNYRVMSATPGDVGKPKAWREIVAENEATLESMQILGGHLVLTFLRDATHRVQIHDLDGKPVREVSLPGMGSLRYTSGSNLIVGTAADDAAYFTFTSFTEPDQVYQMSVATGATELWDKLELPMDTSAMVVEQVWYPSRDGTRISMFVVHRKDMKKDGGNRTILHGYGGFNVKETPMFREWVAVWVERGGVYAMPNLRGGGEYGESWHRAGMLDKKQNVFDDYIAAAEYLIAEKYTSSEKLAIYGRSNGGLLVGAVMTQRPDLYRAVVCGVPLLDMVRYHLFGSGETWVPEYGSAANPEQFRFLHTYSPYHHVTQGTAYPSLLMLATDADDRVDPLHARKFTAAIQWATSSENRPVLMRVERNAGHGGADMAAQKVEKWADVLVYLDWQLK